MNRAPGNRKTGMYGPNDYYFTNPGQRNAHRLHRQHMIPHYYPGQQIVPRMSNIRRPSRNSNNNGIPSFPTRVNPHSPNPGNPPVHFNHLSGSTDPRVGHAGLVRPINSNNISYKQKSESPNSYKKDTQINSRKSIKKLGGLKLENEDIDSTIIASTSKKRSKAIKELRESPGRLCISEAYPPPRVLNMWTKLMKQHDINPNDGISRLNRKNICFVWMPNASWANDGRINGYVFTVEGKQGHVSSQIPTRVIPDMFPMDKMFHGTLCIRLPNESTLSDRFSKKRKKKTMIHQISPIEVLNDMTPSDMENELNAALKDEEDFSSDGSFAGFYVSTDPNRDWEKNVWIVVHTGDRDISRSVWYFLKGMYDPSKMVEEKQKYTSITEKNIAYKEDEGDDKFSKNNKKEHIFVKDTKIMQEKLKEIIESFSSTKSSSVEGELNTDDRKKNVDTNRNDSDSGQYEEKNHEENQLKKKSKLSMMRRRRRRIASKKKISQEFYSSSSSSSSSEEDYDESYYERSNIGDDTEYVEEDTDLLSLDERIDSLFIEEEERKAWKYIKVLNELYKRTISYLPNGMDPETKGIKLPSYVNSKGNVSWENDIMKESNFILSMEKQVKLKRWKIASRLANILGFDLSLDFNIHPEKKDVDNHVNVIHVTSNTFGFNKKNAKTIYYSGCFCRRDIVGAIPVPISPLTGIKILYGPVSSNEQGSYSFPPSTSSNTYEESYKSNRFENKDNNIFIKKSYSNFDNDDDFGGTWSLKNEPSDSEDCFGAFPYGTGRQSTYLRLSPSEIENIQNDKEESQIASRINRTQQNSIGNVHVIPPNEWGPRGLWILDGSSYKNKNYSEISFSDTKFSSINNAVLFTWNDKRFPKHPRLSKDVYRPRTRNFKIRESNLGWKLTLQSLDLKPVAIQMCSPVDPFSS